jgi:hypothetical protein
MASPSTIAFSAAPSIATTGIYAARAGQSIYDVCLATYGTLDRLFKLLVDNNVDGLNHNDASGLTFTFDTRLILYPARNKYNESANINYGSLYKLPDGLSIELRDDGGIELRDDGGYELRT